MPLNKGCMRCIFIDYTSCISKEYRLYLREIQVVVFTGNTSYALKIFMRIKLYKTGEIGKMGLVYSCV